MTMPRLVAILPALMLLAACGPRARDVDRLDRELLNGVAGADTSAPVRAPRPPVPAARSRPAKTRPPAPLPLPPDARIREAADGGVPGCPARFLRFASGASARRLAAFYAHAAAARGYRVATEHHARTIVVAGDRRGERRAFYMTLTPRARRGTEVALLSNAMR